MSEDNNRAPSRLTTARSRVSPLQRLGSLLWIALILVLNGMTTLGHSAETRIESTVTYYHTNLQRSPIMGTDDQGDVLWSQGYAEYGYNEGTDGQAGPEGLSTRFGIGGHVEDLVGDDLRLVYMGARYYDPVIGRFLSMDPAGFVESNPQSFNRYAYANNNPQKYIDPNGEFAFFIPVVVFLGKEALAAAASHYTGGLTDFLSVGRSARNVGKYLAKKFRGSGEDRHRSLGAAASDQFTVRRFVSKKEMKQLKKNGLEFNEDLGNGIPTTTRNFNPKNQSAVRRKLGARHAEFQVDIDATAIPRGETTVTRSGLPEFPLQGNIRPEDIISIKKVPK